MRIIKLFMLMSGIFLMSSCITRNDRQIKNVFEYWMGREIVFPKSSVFTLKGRDTVEFVVKNKYKILTYVDSLGCTSCKLRLPDWHYFMHLLDSMQIDDVSFLYYLSPKKGKDIFHALEAADFPYPVCIDFGDSLNQLNNLPKDNRFQTFLLDKDNKVIAIGNPIHNPKIKELYLKIIQGKSIGEEKEAIQTQVAMPETSFSFGNFDWQEAQTHSFEVKNVGHELLVIQDVTTSCGCITVDYPKEPVRPGSTAVVKVTYKADQQEYFNKTVTVYGNAEQFPLSLHVSGNAKQLTTIDN